MYGAIQIDEAELQNQLRNVPGSFSNATELLTVREVRHDARFSSPEMNELPRSQEPTSNILIVLQQELPNAVDVTNMQGVDHVVKDGQVLDVRALQTQSSKPPTDREAKMVQRAKATDGWLSDFKRNVMHSAVVTKLASWYNNAQLKAQENPKTAIVAAVGIATACLATLYYAVHQDTVKKSTQKDVDTDEDDLVEDDIAVSMVHTHTVA